VLRRYPRLDNPKERCELGWYVVMDSRSNQFHYMSMNVCPRIFANEQHTCKPPNFTEPPAKTRLR
jgi:hypothetical protein